MNRAKLRYALMLPTLASLDTLSGHRPDICWQCRDEVRNPYGARLQERAESNGSATFSTPGWPADPRGRTPRWCETEFASHCLAHSATLIQNPNSAAP